MFAQIPKGMADHPIIQARQRMLKSGKFALLENDEERIKFTVDGLTKHWLQVEQYPTEVKSSVISEGFRNQGNKAFACNPSNSLALESVLELYSKSIVYALPGTRQLSLGYANRSAVLFRANHHEECLQDIDRALYTGYPDELKTKLLIRKAKSIFAVNGDMNFQIEEVLTEARCLIEQFPFNDKSRQMVEDILNNPEKISSVGKCSKKINLSNYVPQIENENSHLSGASDAITLKYSENQGTHVVATRDIKSGEVLMSQKPYATIIHVDSWYNLCAHCGRQCWNGIPCDYCVYVMYCCDECKRAAWSEYHDIECQVLGSTIALQHHTLMGLRLTVKAFKETGSFEELNERLSKLDSLRESNANIPFDPTSYSTIYTMFDNVQHKKPEELLHWSSNAVEITYYLATRTEMFGEKFPRDLNIVKNAEWFTFAAALMSKNMRIAKTRVNGISVIDENGSKKHKMFMLIPVYSYLNHSCCSPIRLYPFAEITVVITPIPIKKGDQVFTCYGPHFMEMEREMRQGILNREYHFVCKCPACKYDWSRNICIPYKDQDLPSKIMKKLTEANKIATNCFHEISRTNNPHDMIRLSKEICNSMDKFYHCVHHPCFEVEELAKYLVDLYNFVSAPWTSFDE